jgi:hypothetical protein
MRALHDDERHERAPSGTTTLEGWPGLRRSQSCSRASAPALSMVYSLTISTPHTRVPAECAKRATGADGLPFRSHLRAAQRTPRAQSHTNAPLPTCSESHSKVPLARV